MRRGQHAAVFDISSELFTQVGICAYGAEYICWGKAAGNCNYYLWEMNAGSLSIEITLNGYVCIWKVLERQRRRPLGWVGQQQ